LGPPLPIYNGVLRARLRSDVLARPRVRAGLALAAAGLGVVLVACLGLFVPVDHLTFEMLGRRTPSAVDVFAVQPTPVLLAILALTATRGARLRALAVYAAAFIVLECVEVAGKLWLPQPAGARPETVLGLHFAHSLPSGHAMRAALVLGLVAAQLPRGLRPVAYGAQVVLCAALVGYGSHYLSDVLAGSLFGLAGAVLLAGHLAPVSVRRPAPAPLPVAAPA
jgi:membrane-associated phospholipid phosphatase